MGEFEPSLQGQSSVAPGFNLGRRRAGRFLVRAVGSTPAEVALDTIDNDNLGYVKLQISNSGRQMPFNQTRSIGDDVSSGQAFSGIYPP